MKSALFAGTFDPPSLGHLDLIRRSVPLCDKLYLGIAQNSQKRQSLFSVEERKSMLEKIVGPGSTIEVVTFTGLAVDFAKENGIDCFIRGLRSFSDLEYEYRMAFANRRLGNIETVFLLANEHHGHISCTLIREVGINGGSLTEFVPKEIEADVRSRLMSASQS